MLYPSLLFVLSPGGPNLSADPKRLSLAKVITWLSLQTSVWT